MKNRLQAAGLALGLSSLTFLVGCSGGGKVLRATPAGIVTGVASEVIYDALKQTAKERAARKADTQTTASPRGQ